jgi:uncharacterized protein (TIGR04255 family)
MFCFPERKDIRLQRAPLAEVICQVRFPPVLRIVEEQPTAFQERIRKHFPQLDIERGVRVRWAPLESEPPAINPEPRTFRFKSADNKTVASLALDFFALSTVNYTHWRDFIELLQLLNHAAEEVYDLPYAVRIGLRYINQLTFDNTGSASVTELWDMLRPELTALPRSNCWDAPLEMMNQLLLAGEQGERLTLRSGFQGGTEPAFVLDFDCYTEGNVSLKSVPGLCEDYHDIIYNAFRWCIRDDRLERFAPSPISEEE